MANQQQDTAYMAVVVNVIIILCIPVPISFLTKKGL